MSGGTGRDWRVFWAGVDGLGDDRSSEAAMRQVGKTVLGQPVAPEQLDLLVATVLGGLGVSSSDRLLDLGCGNGLLTERVAAAAAHVHGVDVSPRMVEDARRLRRPSNVRYDVADLGAGQLASLLGRGDVDAAYAVEVVQHLEGEELAVLLADLAAIGVERLLAVGVPDLDRIRAFYDTPARWERRERLLLEGREQIGRWWTADELGALARDAGWVATTGPQRPSLYTKHYRFDVLFTRVPEAA